MEITGVNWYQRRGHPGELDYLLDGDIYSLTPGQDFTLTLAAFRTKLYRLTRSRGLRYRSRVQDGQLWVEVYRETPGDLFQDA